MSRTVQVGRGTFAGQTTVTGKALTIEGAGAGTVLSLGPSPAFNGYGPEGSATAVLAVRGGPVTVRDLTVDATPPDAYSYTTTGIAFLDGGGAVRTAEVRSGQIGVLVARADPATPRASVVVAGSYLHDHAEAVRLGWEPQEVSLHGNVILGDSGWAVVNDWPGTLDASDNLWARDPLFVGSVATSPQLGLELSVTPDPVPMDTTAIVTARLVRSGPERSTVTDLADVPVYFGGSVGGYGAAIAEGWKTAHAGVATTTVTGPVAAADYDMRISAAAGGTWVDRELRFSRPSGPENLAPPTISGSPLRLGRLTCSPETWDASTTSVSYEWSRDRNGWLPGGTEATYTPTVADAGTNLRCTVRARNARTGETVAVSAPVWVPGYGAATLHPGKGGLPETVSISRTGNVRLRLHCSGTASCPSTGTVTRRPTYTTTATKADGKQRPLATLSRVELPLYPAAKTVTLRFGRVFVRKLQQRGIRRYRVALNVRSTSPLGIEPKVSGVTTLLVPRAPKSSRGS